MNAGNIRSGVIAGIIAAVIWTVISLLIGGVSGTYIAIWAGIFFLVALIGTVVISSFMARRNDDTDVEPPIDRTPRV